MDTQNVCSNNGVCIFPNNCTCKEGYYGENCEFFDCDGIVYNDNSTCSSNGKCILPGVCACRYLTTEEQGIWVFDNNCGKICKSGKLSVGDTCVESYLIYFAIGGSGIAIVGVIVLLFTFLIIAIIIFFLCKKATRFDHIKDAEMILKEAELEQQETGPKISFKKSKIVIDMNDIKLVKLIGQGASNSSVFLAKWNGTKVAYKGFNVGKSIQTTGNVYEEFEKEVSVCVNLNHPSILQFYGACISPPKVGLVIEYAEKGDIPLFLGNYRSDNNNSRYPMKEKLRLLKEIASGMSYLHSQDILHRDLKADNVLINAQEKAKIMDFGLSKTRENSNVTMTKMVGTACYMAPEVIKGGKYANKCDVYSWAILAFVLITEQIDPYGQINENLVLNKVMKSPNFRPVIDESMFGDFKFLMKIIEKNWNHDPENRDSFKEIKNMLEKSSEEKKRVPEQKEKRRKLKK